MCSCVRAHAPLDFRSQLGNYNRAMVDARALASGGAPLAAVELEVLSQEVVIGILAVSLAV